eukprot:TRINITY_DN604_c1_g4_i1.p1 TRINITY_DN604_c1_g4~~TRINITY_DN604_c1_g4_i1.p1  ORF type:complete len:387 (+),score=67.31 TRINITY_DN604_c1_g4_i1:142-1302(+)
MEGGNAFICNVAAEDVATNLDVATHVNKENLIQRSHFQTRINYCLLQTFPPGYKFVPTDEELIHYYLKNKVAGQPLPDNKIYDVNLYNYNPEQLREMFNLWKEKDWYFFTPRKRKYPNGNRPNRAAGDGYWKATGADKPIGIRREIGVRKALVFYKGKPPKGEKTGWIMHEFRVNDSITKTPPKAPLNADDCYKLDDWVLCKIYEKKSDEDKSDRVSLKNLSDVQTPTANANVQRPTVYNEQMKKRKVHSYEPHALTLPDPMMFKNDHLYDPHALASLGPPGLMNVTDDHLLDSSSFPQFYVDTVDLLFSTDMSFKSDDHVFLPEPINSDMKKRTREFVPSNEDDLDDICAQYLLNNPSPSTVEEDHILEDDENADGQPPPIRHRK